MYIVGVQLNMVLQKAYTCVTTSRSRNRTLTAPQFLQAPHPPVMTPDPLKQTMACRPNLAHTCEQKLIFLFLNG